MGRIPVGQCVGGAYGFLFRRFFTIVALSWLPAAIYALGRLAFLWHVEPPIVAGIEQGVHPSIGLGGLVLGYVLFATLVKAVIALPLNRDALDLRDQPVLARLVIGLREVRLFGAYVAIALILIALLVALALGAGGIMMAARWALAQGTPLEGWPVMKIAHAAVAVIAVLIFFYVALRLAFLIAPVAAAEDKARITRAWSLSAGNFWRMFAVFLALAVPLVIAIGACEFAVLGPSLHEAGRQIAARHDHGAFLALVMPHGPVLVTIAAAFMVIANALFAGAGAAAYRALVPQPRRETEVFVEPVAVHEEPRASEPLGEPAPPAEDAVAQETPAAEETAPAEEPGTAQHADAEPAGESETAQAPQQTPPTDEPAMELQETAVPGSAADGVLPPPDSHPEAEEKH